MDITLDAARAEDLKASHNRFNAPLGADPNFSGPVGVRKCTDCCWILLFLVANAALAAFAVYCYWIGDPHRLIHGWDFRAELCGEGGLSDKPYAYFLAPGNSTTAICLEGCPVLASAWAACLYDVDHTTDLLDLPCYDAYVSKPFANRYCLPASETQRDAVLEWLYDPMQVTTRATGDLYRAWDVLAISGLVSATVALFYLICIRIGVCFLPLGCLSLLSLWLLFAGISYMIYEEADRVADSVCGPFEGVTMQDCDRNRWSGSYKALAYSTGVLFIAISLGALTFVYHLWRGAKMVALCARPLRHATCISFLPCLIMLLGAGVYALLITLVSYAAGTAAIETDSILLILGRAKTLNFYYAPRILIFYAVIMAFWWFSLLATVSEYLTASYTCHWFFGKDKSSLIQPFRNSIKNAFMYHFGSLILASVAMPSFRLFKYFLGTIRRFATLLGVDKGKCCSSCFGPCFECYDGALRYLDYQALAYQSLWGGTFCDSAKRGFYLIERNKVNCKRLTASGDYYVWLFQLTTMLSAPAFVFYWLLHMDKTFMDEMTKHVSTVTGMAVVSLIISWFLAQELGAVMRGLQYGSLVSYLSDAEMFVGGQRFADDQIAGLYGEGYEAVRVLKPVEDMKQSKDESMHEFLAESPAEKPLSFPEPAKPLKISEFPQPIKSVRKPSPPAKPFVPGNKSEGNQPINPVDARGNRSQAFEQPHRPPPVPDILRQTMSSATSSDYSSAPSDARFFIPPHVVPPPASPKGLGSSRNKKPEPVATFRSARGPPSPRGRQPGPEESNGSDSLSSYTDSEEEENFNRRPIARPSSRGEAPARHRGAKKGGRKA